MRRIVSGRALRWIAIASGLLVAAVAGLLVACALREGDAGDAKTDAVASVEQATNDEEWLELIARAKAARENPDAPWPEPALGEAVQIVRSCADLPLGAVETQMAIEVSPDGRRTRFVFTYFGEGSTGSLALVLYSGDDVTGCSAHVKEVVQGADRYSGDVDRYLCEQMEKMARGESVADPTLRRASPEVATAYLDSVCR